MILGFKTEDWIRSLKDASFALFTWRFLCFIAFGSLFRSKSWHPMTFSDFLQVFVCLGSLCLRRVSMETSTVTPIFYFIFEVVWYQRLSVPIFMKMTWILKLGEFSVLHLNAEEHLQCTHWHCSLSKTAEILTHVAVTSINVIISINVITTIIVINLNHKCNIAHKCNKNQP